MANGPEFAYKEVEPWTYANYVIQGFSRPGKLTDKAPIESFNSQFRQECLNQHRFLVLEDACPKIEF